MASRAGMFKLAGELIEVLDRIDRQYFITTDSNNGIYLSEDNETWSPKIKVWPEESE